jgi:YHS domain-containing protein
MPGLEKDPVCGATIDPSTCPHEKIGDRDYAFCCEECRNKFIVNPGRYLFRA